MSPTFAVILGFIQHRGKILLLQRSHGRKYGGMWQMVTGHIKEKEDGEKAIVREVKEETGLKAKIVYSGKSYEWKDDVARWIIIPYILEVKTTKIKMSKEHINYKWVFPKDYKKYDCLPGMKEDLKAVKLI